MAADGLTVLVRYLQHTGTIHLPTSRRAGELVVAIVANPDPCLLLNLELCDPDPFVGGTDSDREIYYLRIQIT